MFISLIIPTYNRENLLVQSLKCALKQVDVEYEIIVVDQTKSHKEPTKKFLQNLIDQKKIKYIFSQTASVTNARNIGVENSKGEIIVFIDDDTKFENNFLKKHLEAYQEDIDVVQGRVLEEDCSITASPVWLNPFIRFRGSDSCQNTGPVNNITGCNFSFKKSVFYDIGGFDLNYFGCSTREDSDFGYRAFKAGYKFKFAPEAEIFHYRSSDGGVDSGGVKNQMFDLSYYFCELYFAKKNFSKLAAINYKLRLMLRGYKQINKLIKEASRNTDNALDKL